MDASLERGLTFVFLKVNERKLNVRKGKICSMLNYCEVSLSAFFPIPCGCGGIGIRARLRGVWLCLASSSLAIRITKDKGVRGFSPDPFIFGNWISNARNTPIRYDARRKIKFCNS
jgi:hypothetical protein